MNGFRIKQTWGRVDKALVEAFRGVAVANASDGMNRLSGAGNQLQPMHRDGYLSGPAFTVRARPGDNLMLHKAIDMAQPGDVIVHDGGGEVTNSLIGEMMIAHAKVRGIAGFVINGAMRDREAVKDLNLPIYALGVTPRGPYRNGPGEIGFPICIGGMPVDPGDLVIGDLDGVLSIPQSSVAYVLKQAQKKLEAEERQMELTLQGKLDRSWVDQALRDQGCEFIE